MNNILDEINKYRPVSLEIDEDSCKEATRFGVEMSLRDTIVHSRNDALIAVFLGRIEVREVIRMWYESDKKDIMLNPEFTKAGTAHIHYNANDSRWWCVIFSGEYNDRS